MSHNVLLGHWSHFIGDIIPCYCTVGEKQYNIPYCIMYQLRKTRFVYF